MIKLNSLGKKIGFGYLLIGLMLIATVGTTLWQVHKNTLISDELREVRVPTAQTALTMLNGMNESLAALRAWIILGKEKFREERHIIWKEQIHPSLQQFKQLAPHWQNEADRQRLNLINRKLHKFEHLQQEIETIVHTPDNTPALSVFTEQAQPLAHRLVITIEKMVATEQARLHSKLLGEEEGEKLDISRIMLFEDITLFQSSTEQQLLAIEAYMLTGSNKILKDYRHITQENQRIYTELAADSKSFTLEEQTTFVEISQMRNILLPLLEEMRTNRSSDKWNIANHQLATQAAPISAEIVELIEMISESESALMNATFQRAKDQNEQLNMIIWGLLISGLATCGLFGFFITRSVSRPIEQTLGIANAVAAGDFDVEIRLDDAREINKLGHALTRMTTSLKEMTQIAEAVAAGELEGRVEVKGDKDTLARAINTMVVAIKDSQQQMEAEKRKLLQQDWLKSGFAQVMEKIQGTRTLPEMGSGLLNELIPCLNAHLGVIYVIEGLGSDSENNEDDKAILSPIATYALQAKASSYSLGEGLVGQCALEKRTLLLEQGVLQLDTGIGVISPAAISLQPVLFEKELVGVLEIACLTPFTPQQQELLSQVSSNLGIFINTIIGRLRTESLLKRSQKQANKLKQREHQLEQSNLVLEQNTRKAVQANRSKSEFLANMSHELRTPLNSMLILAETLSSNKEGNLSGTQQEACQLILQSGSDLLMLINDILDLAKVEAGKMLVNNEPFPLKELAVKVDEKFTHMAEDKGLTLNIETTPNAPQEMNSDRVRIEQILRNLLSNALKFTHEGGVSVTIGRPEKTVHFQSAHLSQENSVGFAINDSGIGISDKKLESIFNAFEQVDGSTSRQYGGTGLGLSISHDMAQLLGGEIQVESRPGTGSTFTLYLPLAPLQKSQSDPAQPTAIHITDDRDSIQPEQDSILVIDDDPTFTKKVSQTLHEKGIKCLIAGNGADGLTLVERFQPNAIVLDIDLPDIDGRKIFRILKEQAAHIPVYFISIHKKENNLLSNGAVGFMSKPVSPHQLSYALDQLRSISIFPLKTLLIVEDEKVMRDNLATMLTEQGLEVVTAENGEQALELIRSHRIDGMLLDLILPGISGLELLEAIAAEAELQQPPVIIYSAKDIDTEERQKLNHYTHTLIKKNGNDQELLLYSMIQNIFPPTIRSEEATTEVSNTHYESLKGKKVLLVDDDTRNLFAVSLLLKEAEMPVVMAENGQKALDILAEDGGINIVLMDIMMPVMDGYEAIANIRKQPPFAHLPIIAVTANAMEQDREKCLKVGANDHLAKPVNKEALFSMMAKYLQSDNDSTAEV